LRNVREGIENAVNRSGKSSAREAARLNEQMRALRVEVAGLVAENVRMNALLRQLLQRQEEQSRKAAA
jgi:hypothetical protein